jgi:hypothetical protein
MGPKRFGLFVSIVVVIQIVIDDDQILQTPSIIFSIGSATCAKNGGDRAVS